MNLLFEVISLLICIGIPVLGGIYFAVKGKGYFLTFLTGILSFVVTQMILRIPLLGYLKTNWEWFMILPYSHYYIYMAIAAFSAGVFEETGRVVGLGVLRKGKTQLDGCSGIWTWARRDRSGVDRCDWSLAECSE